MEEKKKPRINIHIVFGIILLAIITICIVKLIQWNGRTTVVDLDIEEGAYDMECLDFYVYPEEEMLAARKDDGVEDIVVFGNNYVNNYGEKHSVINIMKDKLDANIIDLTVDKSKLGCFNLNITNGIDSFSLYNLIQQIDSSDFSALQISAWEEAFANHNRYDSFMDNIVSLDFNDVDTVMIMYSLYDYYNEGPTIYLDEYNPYGYHGALLSTVKYLQDEYPHLSIIISSFTPEYITDDEGNMLLSLETDFGWGTSSAYFDHQYAIATQRCVSFIDNYFYEINEKNITDYLDCLELNDKGIDLIGEHVVNFIKHK